MKRKAESIVHARTHTHHNATLISTIESPVINHVERSDAKNGERGGESGVCENDERPRGGG